MTGHRTGHRAGHRAERGVAQAQRPLGPLGPLVVIGDVLLDRDVEGTAERLCPDAPVPVVDEQAVRERPGGAGLAACLAARAQPDRKVNLVTALGDDEVSGRLRALLAPRVTLLELPLDRPPAQKTRICAGDRPLLRLDRGGGGRIGDAPEVPGGAHAAIRGALAGAGAVLVSDYGQGVAAHSGLRSLLRELGGRSPLVWDPHPRGPKPVAGVLVATPSLAEARSFAGVDAESSERPPALRAAGTSGRRLLRSWQCSAVAVTLGKTGALLSQGGGSPLLAPAPTAVEAAHDTCGAGDRFATAVALDLAGGALPSEAVVAAVEAASEFVTTGGAIASYADEAIAPDPESPDRGGESPTPAAPSGLPHQRAMVAADTDAATVAARVRAAGGTVVATGGCFEVLHAGHVATLQAARALGDCLVVCLNSDDSVRALKGPSRPLNSATDRAAVLSSLACVDAVAVFDETTPAAVLAGLRPDVWVKGSDYGGADLPESSLLEEWGGQTVVVPYVPGHSTSRIAASGRAAEAQAGGTRQA